MLSPLLRLRLTNRLIFSLLAMSLAFGTVGCKGKKKLAEQQQLELQAEKTKKLNALQALLDTKIRNRDDLAAMEREFAAMDIPENDAQLQILKKKVRYYLDQERERLEREEMAVVEEKQTVDKTADVEQQLNLDFGQLASGGKSAGNQMKKDEIVNLFSSARAPVLIIISQNGAAIDYDRPTTIGKYLDYLMDTGNNNARVGKIIFDDYGKITELELIKL